MKKALRVILALVVTIILVTPNITVTAQTKQFKDLSSTHWAKKEIDYLVGLDIVTGYPNGNYGVTNPVTRAQAAAMVVRSFGWVGEWENPNYNDVTPSHWAYNAIAHLYGMDIFKPGNSYYPEKALTRGEMAHILVNAFQLSSIKAAAYTDVLPDHPYYEAINILSGSSITSGYPDGTFRPEAAVNRTEFAVFMSRVLDESFRVQSTSFNDVDGVIYDLKVANQYYRLESPLVLTDVWLAPLELFEKIGYVIQEIDNNSVSLKSSQNGSLLLKVGEKKVWVGDTSVELTTPLTIYNGKFYIESHPILEVLQTPLVFYPDDFLIALEAPQVTPQQIMVKRPATKLDTIHTALPYWHWTKKDKDYLELISLNKQVESKRTALYSEMNKLTEAYVKIEQEVELIKGISYISDHVSGKLDAISRALEARYNLLNTGKYDYPQVGKSGALGQIGQSQSYSYDYLVYDHVYEHIDENINRLSAALKADHIIDLSIFEGLKVFGVPFTIVQNKGQANEMSWSGLASGSKDMFVIHSGLGTFYHELGHNWDAMLGDDSDYLSIRAKTGYTEAENAWAHRVHENFAEDFAIALMKNATLEDHSGVFGAPTQQQVENLQAWIVEKSAGYKSDASKLILNNMSIVPDVIASANGKLNLSGIWTTNLIVTLEDTNGRVISSNTVSVPELASGVHIDLTQKGVYILRAGSIATTVVYE